MSKKKFSASISGKGYYIALILCAAAIGISGYLYYRNESGGSLQKDPASSNQNGDIQAVATEPTETDPTQGNQQNPTSPKKPSKVLAPVAGDVICQYAMDTLQYNQTTRDWRVHNGVDYAAEAGAPVMAAADGSVFTIYEDESLGTTVVITHSGGYVTKYSSLSEQLQVVVGDQVTAGQTIGYVGNSALLECAIGDHMHFTVTCNDQYVDPMQFLNNE